MCIIHIYGLSCTFPPWFLLLLFLLHLAHVSGEQPFTQNLCWCSFGSRMKSKFSAQHKVFHHRLTLPSQAWQPGWQHNSRAAPSPPPLGLAAPGMCSPTPSHTSLEGPSVGGLSISPPLWLSLYFTGIWVSHHFKGRTPSSFWNRVLDSITTGKGL